MSQDEDKVLDTAWRRASTADAGRPSDRTRAAILAEAAAAARRRQPAANAPRYWMRLVAGVAVVGVGLVLWRQTDVRLPGDPPVVAVPMAQESAQEDADSASVQAPVPSTPQSAAPAEQAFSQAPAPESRKAATGRADTSPARVEQAPPPPVPPLAPAPVTSPATQDAGGVREAEDDERLELEEVQVTGARVQGRQRAVGPRALPGATAAPRTAPAPTALELLRIHFPEQYASAQPRRVWAVLDGANRVVTLGELQPGEPIEALAAQIERDAGAAPGPWRVERISNARGQPVEFAISRLPR